MEKQPIRWRRQPFIAVVLVLLAALYARAGDVKIIANESVKAGSITINELRDVFLEKRTQLKDGSTVVPVLERSGPAHEAFLKEYLDRDSAEIQTYYQGLTFSGKGTMPKEVESDAEVVAYVARTRGAIGYVGAEALTVGVKVLAIASAENVPRRLITRVNPDYPDTLRERGITGVVRMQLTISPQGRVENVTLLGGNPILAESAISAVRQWVYTTSHAYTVIEVSIDFPPTR